MTKEDIRKEFGEDIFDIYETCNRGIVERAFRSKYVRWLGNKIIELDKQIIGEI